MNLWTNEEIEKILVQLDQRKLPFENILVLKINHHCNYLDAEVLQMFMKQKIENFIKKNLRLR